MVSWMVSKGGSNISLLSESWVPIFINICTNFNSGAIFGKDLQGVLQNRHAPPFITLFNMLDYFLMTEPTGFQKWLTKRGIKEIKGGISGINELQSLDLSDLGLEPQPDHSSMLTSIIGGRY